MIARPVTIAGLGASKLSDDADGEGGTITWVKDERDGNSTGGAGSFDWGGLLNTGAGILSKVAGNFLGGGGQQQQPPPNAQQYYQNQTATPPPPVIQLPPAKNNLPLYLGLGGAGVILLFGLVLLAKD